MDSPHHPGDRYPDSATRNPSTAATAVAGAGSVSGWGVVVATVVGSVWVASCRMGSVAEG